jgi:adenylate cyclase
MSFVRELKRRNVFRVGVAYLIIGWLLLQVSDTLVPALHLPEWFQSGVALFLILGFPLALFFAWAFELTPDGLKKEKDIERSESVTPVTGRKLDFVIIGLLTAALGYFAYDKFVASPPAPQDSIQSIAVMPFINMSSDPEQEYLSDGLSEELLNLLAKIPELRVAARTSSFSFKDQNLEIPEIAERLNVGHVLEGSVRKAGNQIRITAQLIRADDGFHIWSATYDRELENIFVIQDEVAAAVVDSLKITLLGEQPKATETDPEAYALYLQARYLMSQGAEGHKQAETLLKQALDIDPGFAPALTVLGNVYNNQANMFGVRPVDEAVELARDAIQRALEIDPLYARAHAALGDLDIRYAYEFKAAYRHMQQALALNPGDTYILNNAARVAELFGRIDEAIDLYRQSIVLDPLSPGGHGGLGILYYRAHRLEEAANSLQLAGSLNPSASFFQLNLVLVLLAQGDAPAALVALERTSDFWHDFGMALVQHELGDAGASDAALNEFKEKYQAGEDYQVASIYAFRDEIDLAFDWLDKAYDERDTGLPFVHLDPLLASLHDDPRWESFLDKMGLPP